MKETVAIYGSGAIGACQATLTTGNGYSTVVVGRSQAGLDRCRRTIEQNWDDLIREGLATAANKASALRLLTITNDPAALRERTFIFEAVAEDLETKCGVYAQIEATCPPNAVVASCTSSIGADRLAEAFQNPARFLIAHPFQPVHMLPLVEVVCHPETSRETLARTRALLEDLARQVVVLRRSVPGFLVNRLAQALFRESIHLMEQDVVTAVDIDRAMKYAVGMRYASIGLLEYFDAVGFQLESAIAQNVYPDLCAATELQNTVRTGLAAGTTGQAAGRGLYDWSCIDQADFRRRMQSPYFPGIRRWHMPE